MISLRFLILGLKYVSAPFSDNYSNACPQQIHDNSHNTNNTACVSSEEWEIVNLPNSDLKMENPLIHQNQSNVNEYTIEESCEQTNEECLEDIAMSLLNKLKNKCDDKKLKLIKLFRDNYPNLACLDAETYKMANQPINSFNITAFIEIVQLKRNVRQIPFYSIPDSFNIPLTKPNSSAESTSRYNEFRKEFENIIFTIGFPLATSNEVHGCNRKYLSFFSFVFSLYAHEYARKHKQVNATEFLNSLKVAKFRELIECSYVLLEKSPCMNYPIWFKECTQFTDGFRQITDKNLTSSNAPFPIKKIEDIFMKYGKDINLVSELCGSDLAKKLIKNAKNQTEPDLSNPVSLGEYEENVSYSSRNMGLRMCCKNINHNWLKIPEHQKYAPMYFIQPQIFSFYSLSYLMSYFIDKPQYFPYIFYLVHLYNHDEPFEGEFKHGKDFYTSCIREIKRINSSLAKIHEATTCEANPDMPNCKPILREMIKQFEQLFSENDFHLVNLTNFERAYTGNKYSITLGEDWALKMVVKNNETNSSFSLRFSLNKTNFVNERRKNKFDSFVPIIKAFKVIEVKDGLYLSGTIALCNIPSNNSFPDDCYTCIRTANSGCSHFSCLKYENRLYVLFLIENSPLFHKVAHNARFAVSKMKISETPVKNKDDKNSELFFSFTFLPVS